jgi:hypothetical protein
MSQDPSRAGSAHSAADSDPAWHINLNFYLWLPGTHGILGANGYDVAYKASAGDLLSNFRFGLMAALAAQRGRFVMIDDMIWVRIEANKQVVLPVPNVPQLTGQAKAGQFILTPEFGYRVFDGEKLKIDAIGGFRYWHLESSLQFTPPVRNNNFSTSSNWADPLMGGRIQVPLSRRVLATVLGDAGGWGTGAQSDYQILGILGFQVSSKWSLGAGYRYLYVNYRSGSFIYQTAMSGALIGVNYSLK